MSTERKYRQYLREKAAIEVDTNVGHKDSFGTLSTVVQGGSTWTSRLLRSTKINVAHIAKGDVFSYKAQLNHDKKLNTNLDGFHLHIIPVGAVTAGQQIHLSYAWGWVSNGDVFPSTLPNTGNTNIVLATGDQYKYLIKPLVSSIAYPTSEAYSSEFFIEVTRVNDGGDTYAGEFALVDGDVHYVSDQFGSVSEYTD